MFGIVFLVFCVTISESVGKLSIVSRIVGGNDAGPNEFPFMASLQINGRHLCGGTIINNNTVLTAAHCIEKNMTVVVGTSDLRTGGVRFDVARTIPHPKFTNFYYDVALVKIEGFFTFGPTISQILLNGNRVEKETPCTAYGWGRLSATTSTSPSLKYIKLKVISTNVCSVIYEAIDISIDLQHVCTLTKIKNGVCLGDSGGPLVDLNGRQIGIVSFVRPCANGYPDVYSRISHFITWINENLREQ